MKNLFLALFVFIGLSLSAQEESSLNLVTGDGPVITFDTEVLDYGTIEQGSNGERFFTLKNEGTEPLIISRCKGSCGCTVPACPKEPILPGKSSKIKVKYDTNRMGQFTKSITVTSNATEETKVIKITGKVTAKAE